MSNIDKLSPLKSPAQAAREIAQREKEHRRRLGITQQQLASKSGVSLGSLRRFEQTGQIQLESMVRLMRVLGCDSELDGLFAKPAYRSIEEVIQDNARHRTR